MEVARVSLVDMKGRVIMNQYVTPRYDVLDFNTAFSGVEPEHLENAIILEAARTQIFNTSTRRSFSLATSFKWTSKDFASPAVPSSTPRMLFSNGLDTPKSAFYPKKPALQALVSEFLEG